MENPVTSLLFVSNFPASVHNLEAGRRTNLGHSSTIDPVIYCHIYYYYAYIYIYICNIRIYIYTMYIIYLYISHIENTCVSRPRPITTVLNTIGALLGDGVLPRRQQLKTGWFGVLKTNQDC